MVRASRAGCGKPARVAPLAEKAGLKDAAAAARAAAAAAARPPAAAAAASSSGSGASQSPPASATAAGSKNMACSGPMRSTERERSATVAFSATCAPSTTMPFLDMHLTAHVCAAES